jgi:hypothetical protein
MAMFVTNAFLDEQLDQLDAQPPTLTSCKLASGGGGGVRDALPLAPVDCGDLCADMWLSPCSWATWETNATLTLRVRQPKLYNGQSRVNSWCGSGSNSVMLR